MDANTDANRRHTINFFFFLRFTRKAHKHLAETRDVHQDQELVGHSKQVASADESKQVGRYEALATKKGRIL